MRQLIVWGAALVLVLQGVGQVRADQVEVKGPHLCCGQCVKTAEGLLSKIKGLADARADIKSKTVSFTAVDDKAARAGIQALVDGGFFGVASIDGKDVKIAVPPGGGKSLTMVVTGVHVCCSGCEKALQEIIKYAKVSFEGKGPQRTLRIEGQGCLGHDEVMNALRKAGFNGTLLKEAIGGQ